MNPRVVSTSDETTFNSMSDVLGFANSHTLVLWPRFRLHSLPLSSSPHSRLPSAPEERPFVGNSEGEKKRHQYFFKMHPETHQNGSGTFKLIRLGTEAALHCVIRLQVGVSLKVFRVIEASEYATG